ncbi:MAG: thioredoxin domain-containing protein [Hyphomicrobiales bacterium]|nr:thioredoxin domain-containing protein [Hyphomicrobiales bacterium]
MTKNQLTNETSPYLLQHKDNPVHWRPWGPEALAEAKAVNKPVLLSVGYAACHWCHVMAHESFENDAIAGLMNDLFVNIKVDREERPDVDALYMSALHHLGEQGGWPLTMFLTPDAEPFWGGTYFPPEPRFGRPGFPQVLQEVARVFREEPEKIQSNTGALGKALRESASTAPTAITMPMISDIASRMAAAFDPIHGGLQGAPKFPNCSILNFVWKGGLRFGHATCTDAIEKTLLHISQGGIYDHIGGGFSRYSVDARWLVPHFEKMLYDNAQLIDLMTEVWKERRTPLLAIRIAETVDWLMREMKAPDGGFASALDADSEGVEGKFYVWSRAEIIAALGEEDGAFFCQVYDISEHGNWEETNIPNRLKSLELLPDEDEARLYALRSNLLAKRALRERPSWDDKVLADWNGLMIAALAKAGQAFEHPEWVDVAKSAYEFVKLRLVKDGRLMHSYRAGQAKTPGVATDYANMIASAIALQQVTGDAAFLADAKSWTRTMDERYTAESGGYYLSADDTTDVMIRTLAAHDDATPNANSIMLANLNALYLLTGEESYRARAQKLYEAFSGAIAHRFVNHCGFLNSLIDVIEPKLIVITGAEDEAGMPTMRNALVRASLSGAVIHTYRSDEIIPESSPAAGKTSIGGKATAYICIGQTCSLPVTDANDLASQLRPDQDKAVIR